MAVSAGELDLGQRPLRVGGCAGGEAGLRWKTQLALDMLQGALERGHLQAGWIAADDAFGISPSFREGLAALGMRYVLDVPAGFTVWPPDPAWTSAEYQGLGRPAKPGWSTGRGAP